MPAALRSTVLGTVSGAGSLGALLAAPIGQLVTQAHGWRSGIGAFILLALLMLPAARFAGRVDRLPLPASAGGGDQSARAALGTALRHAPSW